MLSELGFLGATCMFIANAWEDKMTPVSVSLSFGLSIASAQAPKLKAPNIEDTPII